MSPLERLVRCAEASESWYSWASVALARHEAAQIVDHIARLQDELDRANLRVAELEAAARRCADCGRGARELKPWFENVDRQVWLGPGCWRKREQQARRAAIGDHMCQVVALPIGGGR